MALIGIVLLIGIVKKNGIMMVDFALQAQREHGKTPLEAVRRTELAAAIAKLTSPSETESSPAAGKPPACSDSPDLAHTPGDNSAG